MRRVFWLRFLPRRHEVRIKAPDSTVLVTDADSLSTLSLFSSVSLKSLGYKKKGFLVVIAAGSVAVVTAAVAVFHLQSTRQGTLAIV
jgi:hypothetical protein